MIRDVRAMTRSDIPEVQRVEGAAGTRFRDCDDPRISRCASDQVFTRDELIPFIADGRAWVATEDADVVGFVVIDVIDDCAHVEEIAVAPSAGRRGHGTALLAQVQRWAARNALRAVTLTTFRDVPWNGPWYTRLGFRALPEDEWTPTIRALRDAEERNGLVPELRIVMQRDVQRGEIRDVGNSEQ